MNDGSHIYSRFEQQRAKEADFSEEEEEISQRTRKTLTQRLFRNWGVLASQLPRGD